MHIERFDAATATDAELKAWHAALVAIRHDTAPLGVDEPFEYFERLARVPNPVEPEFTFGAYDGGRLRAAMSLWWWLDEANEHRMECWIDGGDEPTVRALLAEATRFATEVGRTTLGLVTIEGSAFEAVADAIGATIGLVEHRNVVATAGIDTAALRAAIAQGEAGASPEYELRRFDGEIPEEFVATFLSAKNSMNDAPRGSLDINDVTFRGDHLRTAERVHRDRGVDRWTVCAVERATGTCVGLTELFVPDVPGAIAEQNDTVVVPAHRGHGLGLWMKATNLLRLAGERPHLAGVETWNAEQNSHMLAVNHAIGFRCHHRIAERDLAATDLAAKLAGA